MPDNSDISESYKGLSNSPSSYEVNPYGLADSVQSSTNVPSGSSLAPIQVLDSAPSSSSGVSGSGVFTVGSTGTVSIDYLYDGSAYRGELAIFNLSGLDQFGVGTQAYIQEAARRASQNSPDNGYVVIRDQIEGARFTGTTPTGNDYNSGTYLGVKTFNLQPGSQFGIMLVPNDTVETARNSPDLTGDGRPLFSIPSANPNNDLQLVQVPLLNNSNQNTSSGTILAFEDQRPERGSDLDYNDLVFQISGATGGATSIDTVIKPEVNWLNTPVGQQIRSVSSLSPVGATATSAGRTQISKALWRRTQL